jgi:uncharacterized repeat protein (TIGR01451 family)
MKHNNSNLTRESQGFSWTHLGQTAYRSCASIFKVLFTQGQNKLGLNKIVTISCLFFLCTALTVEAATFTSVTNGSFGSSNTWNRNGTPNLNNWPNDKVVINHAVTAGNLTMNGSAHWITINSGGSLTLTGTLNVVSSGQVHVNSGGSLTATNIYLNTSSTCNLNGTITAYNNMHLDGAFVGSPTIVVGNYLLAGAAGKLHDFNNLNLQVGGNMTVQNSKLRWDAGSVTVAGNFVLMGTGDVDVPEGSILDVEGTLSVTNNLTIDGQSGPGSGGIVSWEVGNVVLTGNNKGLNKCPLPYASPFDLKTCSQALASDVTNPIITLTGNASETVAVGSTYTDAGATATDDTDGNLTSSIATSSNVDANTIGSYTVTYNVNDAAGNAATEVTRTVVVADVTAPTITLTGNATESIIVGETYTDAGATASDDIDGDITGSIVTSSDVDANTAGSYSVTYNVNDAGGNVAAEVSRSVTVIAECSLTFSEVATSAGLTDSDDNWSVAWGDFNNDCYEDLFIAGYGDGTPNLLYKNNGDGTFTKMGVSAGDITTEQGSYVAGSWGDYDNDGYLDIAVSGNVNTASEIYHNNGDETFSPVYVAAIVNSNNYAHGVSFVDYDNDGYLDLFMTSYFSTEYNLLYNNNQSGGFVSDGTSSLTLDAATSVASAWADYDNDGDQDVFVANAGGEKNLLYRNDGNGVFTKITTGAIVNDEQNSVGASWGDYNSDGYMDLFVSNANQNNALYTNNAGAGFTKVTSGVMVTDGGHSHGSSWVDYDNDGDLDLYVGNDQNTSDYLYVNDGTGSFTKETIFDSYQRNSMGLGWADYDNDGDLDLAIANRDSQGNYLFNNSQTGGCENNSLTLKLEADGSGIGARIAAKATINSVAVWQHRQVLGQTGGGVGGQSSLKPTFGFGDATVVDSLVIYWPNGAEQVFTNVDLSTVNTTCYNVTMVSTATVSGEVFYDINGNCSKDAGEPYVSNLQISSDGSDYVTATNSDGYYKLNTSAGTHVLTMNNDASWSITGGCPASISVNASQVGQTYGSNNFAVSPSCADVKIDGSLTTTAQRIGFRNTISLVVENNGGSEATGVTVSLTLDEDVVYVSASPTPDDVTGAVLTWNVAQMDVNESLRFDIIDSVKVGNSFGDTISLCANMTANESMCGTSDVCFTEYAVGSLDPNDILLMNPGYGERHIIDNREAVSYKIRFQNVGNWMATNVVILDELSEFIDLNSLHNIRATHGYSWSVDTEGMLQVEFIDINLIDSVANEPESHGAFEFSAFLKPNTPSESIVENKASIYFDFNEPVETNTVFNTIEDLEALVSRNQLHLISFPNPSSNSITLGLSKSDGSLVPIDIAKVQIIEQGTSIITDVTLIGQGDVPNYVERNLRSFDVVRPSYINPRVEIGELSTGSYVIVVWDKAGNMYSTKQLITQ